MIAVKAAFIMDVNIDTRLMHDQRTGTMRDVKYLELHNITEFMLHFEFVKALFIFEVEYVRTWLLV